MSLRLLVSESEPNDTQPLLRGLAEYGDVEIVGIAHDGLECAAMCFSLRPDVALVRERMSALSGPRACQLIAQISPETLSVLVRDPAAPRADGSETCACGARAAVTLDGDVQKLMDLLRRLIEERPSAADWEYDLITDPARLPVTIAVTGSKGGIGKTTTAVNLSLALQQKYRGQVVLVDFIGQYGDVCIMLDLVPQANILDLAEYSELDEALVRSVMTTHPSGLHVLAGVNGVDAMGATGKMPLALASQLLGVLRRMYRVIVLDIPALAHPLSSYVYQRSDHICLVTALADLTTVRSTASLLQSILAEHVPAERVKLVVSRHSSDDDYTVEQLEESLRHAVAARIPWSREAVSSEANLGIPYLLARPNSPPAAAIKRLADLLASETRSFVPTLGLIPDTEVATG